VLLPPRAARVHIHLSLESQADQGGAGLAIRWRVAGHSSLPAGKFVFADDRTLPVNGGSSVSALWPDNKTLPAEVWYRPDNTNLPRIPCDLATTELPAPWRWRLLLAGNDRLPGVWSSRDLPPGGFPPGSADQDSPLIPYLPGQPLWLSSPGILPLVDPAPGTPDTARTVAAADREWLADPIVPGLQGKIIVLDPAGGGSDTDGTGPLGTRGATLNLETALLAGQLLTGCGAEVHLTRHGETILAAEDKVRLAGDVGADLFLTIGRHPRDDTLTASHHPGSETGMAWAALFLQAAAPLTGDGDSLGVTPSYDYLLRHTACPALEIRLPGPATPRQEMLFSDRGWQRAEARAVLLSIVSLFQPEQQLAPSLDVAAVIAGLEGGLALNTVDWAELDGNLMWSPLPGHTQGTHSSTEVDNSLDSIHGPGLPDLIDRHTLEIHARGAWQLWLLEKSGAAVTSKLMMHKP
jgi:N-acetylmuramoyl-L-alanine amidase